MIYTGKLVSFHNEWMVYHSASLTNQLPDKARIITKDHRCVLCNSSTLDYIIIVMEGYMLDGIELSRDSYAQHVSRVQKKGRDYVGMFKKIDHMLTN